MLIVYCKTCGRRIADAELSSGKARQVDENEYECGCADPAAPPPAAPAVAARRPTTGSTPTQARPQRITKQIPTRKGAHTSDGARSAVDAKAKSNSMLLIIGASIFVTVIGVLVIATRDSSATSSSATASSATKPPVAESPKTPPPEPIAPVKAPEAPAPPPKVEPAPKVAETVQPPRSGGNEMEELRNDLAAGKLREAREFASAHPDDPWAYKDKLEALAGTFRSTPAGKEAQTLLANLKVPEKAAQNPATPAPATSSLPGGSGDWKVIIGPNNLDGINSQCRADWIAVDGAMEKKPNTDNAGQSAAEFGDGEFRVTFEATKASSFFFAPHQGVEGIVGVHLYRPQLDSLAQGKHEMLFTCLGDKFKCTLDGKVLQIENSGSPRSGKMQFNYHEGSVRIYAIEYRPLGKP